MTFRQFLEKYNGKSNVGNTTENKGECVGLVSVWVDALNLPHIWGHACDLFNNADEKFFKKILNTPEAIPKEGDIVVWSKAFNKTYGHTGIATGTGDLKTFECFEQNDPLGSNCHLKTYNYNFVIGWLRPISQTGGIELDIQIIQNSDNWLALLQRYNLSNNKDLVFAELDKLPLLEDANREKDKQLQIKDQELTGLREKASDLEERLEIASAELIALKANYNASQTTLDELSKQNEQFRREIEELKNTSVVPVLKTWDYFKLFIKSLFSI